MNATQKCWSCIKIIALLKKPPKPQNNNCFMFHLTLKTYRHILHKMTCITILQSVFPRFFSYIPNSPIH